ncbi:MAG: ABC transporter permease [Phycisphaerales bacterium]
MQTAALLTDSWRLLKSRKLFWITLIINLFVVLLYGSVGFNDKGVSILFGLAHFEVERFAVGLPLARELYLSIFSNFIVTLWLGWIAAALAVISTTSIFPDFLGEGAIDMVLAKPISRMRVFLVKYLGALLFVLLQVATFCIGAFACVGLRLHEWNWGLFMAIPLVVLFFSYLYCVNVFVGVLTRSTIAALIATAIFWFVLWLTSFAETITQQITALQEEEAKAIEADVARLTESLAALAAQGKNSDNSDEFERTRGQLQSARDELPGEQKDVDLAHRWLLGIRIATAALPKHEETINLVDRWVGKDPQRSLTDILMGGVPRPEPSDETRRAERRRREAAERRVDQDRKSESAWWIVGSSLAFELVVLGLGAWVFVRRDF